MADSKETKDAKQEVVYFRSAQYAGLTIVKKDGSRVRFTPYFDTFKGDKVKVGFLATDDVEVIDRCETLGTIETITAKEFEKDTGTLVKAPVYSV